MNKTLLFLISLGVFVFSIVVGLLIPHSATVFLKVALILVIPILLFKNKREVFWTLIFFAMFLVGLSRTGWDEKFNKLEYTGPKRTIQGIIINEPKISGSYQSFLLKTKENKILMNVTTSQFPKYNYGDKISFVGKLEKTEDKDINQGILAKTFLPKIKKIEYDLNPFEERYIKLRIGLIKIRKAYERQITALLSEPSAGLLNGILFGSKAELSKELYSLLTVTGTVHIIALSGFNITIIVGFLLFMTKGFSKRLGLIVPTVGIIFFVLATGLAPSIVRAAIMGWVLLAARYFGRQNSPGIAILFSACIMIFINPQIILYDIGFQLSFGAVIGIVYLSNYLEKFFVSKNLSATLAANITTWPIIRFYFGRVSLISPIANLLILPVIPALMLFGFVVASVSFISKWLADLMVVVPWFILEYLLRIIKYFGSFKMSQIPFKIESPLIIIGYFLILFDFMLFLRRASYGKK